MASETATDPAVSPAVKLLGHILEELARIRAILGVQTAQGEARRQRDEALAERLPPGSVEAWLACWNANRGRLPECRSAKSPARRRRILAALALEADLGRWEQAVRALAASEFHNGSNDRGWTASADFLLQPGRLEEWLEKGQEFYRRKAATSPTTKPQVWCSWRIGGGDGCGEEGLFGPGTRNPDMADTPLCAEHWEASGGKVGE